MLHTALMLPHVMLNLFKITWVYNLLPSRILSSFVLMLPPLPLPPSFNSTYSIVLWPIRKQSHLNSFSIRNSKWLRMNQKRGLSILERKGECPESSVINDFLRLCLRAVHCRCRHLLAAGSEQLSNSAVLLLVDIIFRIRATEVKAMYQGQCESNKVNIWRLLGQRRSWGHRGALWSPLTSFHGCIQIRRIPVRLFYPWEAQLSV